VEAAWDYFGHPSQMPGFDSFNEYRRKPIKERARVTARARRNSTPRGVHLPWLKEPLGAGLPKCEPLGMDPSDSFCEGRGRCSAFRFLLRKAEFHSPSFEKY
jgi:hypothetical protein